MNKIWWKKTIKYGNQGGLIGIIVSLTLNMMMGSMAREPFSWVGSVLYGFMVGFTLTFGNGSVIDLTHQMRPGYIRRLLPRLGLTFIVSFAMYYCIAYVFQYFIVIYSSSNIFRSSLGVGLIAVMVSFYFLFTEEREALLQKILQASDKLTLPGKFVIEYGLSDREQEVVELLVRRQTYQEIATSLFISLATVKTHANNIYQKTMTKNRKELLEKLASYMK